MKKTSLILLTAFAAATTSHGAVVVSYDGINNDYATTAQTIVAPGGTTGTQTTHTNSRTYSTSTTLLTPSANYTGPSIYGGFYHTLTSSVGFTQGNQAILRGNDAGNPIRTQSMYATSANVQSFTLNSAFLFATTGTGPYEFDATSELTWTARSTAEVAAGITSSMRFLVVANGSTYLSETENTWNGTSPAPTYTLSNPNLINWALWTPGADMSFSGLSYNVLGSDLSNITFAGFATNQSSATVGRNASTLDTTAFSANLAIPEPGTLALVGIALGSLLLFRRRR